VRISLEPILVAAVLFAPAAVAAQSPRLDMTCIEPFATSMGYVLTPQCPPQPLATLIDHDPYDLANLPPIESDPLGDPQRRQLRIYDRRIPGTELYMMPSPLRNQWMYSPGQLYPGPQTYPLSPREATSDFVFGLRVPF